MDSILRSMCKAAYRPSHIDGVTTLPFVSIAFSLILFVCAPVAISEVPQEQETFRPAMNTPFACRIDVTENDQKLNFIAVSSLEDSTRTVELSYEFIIQKSSRAGTIQSRQSGDAMVRRSEPTTLATIGIGKSPDLTIHARLTVRDPSGRMFTCDRYEVPDSSATSSPDIRL